MKRTFGVFMQHEKDYLYTCIATLQSLIQRESTVIYTSQNIKKLCETAVIFADQLLVEMDKREPSWAEVRRNEE